MTIPLPFELEETQKADLRTLLDDIHPCVVAASGLAAPTMAQGGPRTPDDAPDEGAAPDPEVRQEAAAKAGSGKDAATKAEAERDVAAKAGGAAPQAAPGGLALAAGLAGAAFRGFRLSPERVKAKQAQAVVNRVRDMYLGTIILERRVAAYNAKVREAAPELFDGIAKAARGLGLDEAGMLRRVHDTRDADPALAGFRERMRALAQRPEFAAERTAMHGLAKRIAQDAHYVGTTLANMEGRDPEAIDKIRESIDLKIGGRAKGIPALDAETPSERPDSLRERLDESLKQLSERLQEFVRNLIEAVGRALSGPR